MCRSRRELTNEYLLAKFGFDTAENELSRQRQANALSALLSERGSILRTQMNKLYRARSLLYRRQILQVNVRWKAHLCSLAALKITGTSMPDDSL